jgi:hypothetical protein
MYRQGDVLLIPLSDLPDEVMPVPRDPMRGVVLALGETTGHAHAIISPRARLFRTDPPGEYFLLIPGPSAELRHEEHAPIALPAGAYRVVQQREYAPEAPSPVAD